nr:terminase family protein [Sphingomonas daechungensis]
MNADAIDWQMELIANASEEEQRRLIWGMSPIDVLRFDAKFENWAHRNQFPPSGDGWRTWLMMAGRGFGKTRAGAEWIHSLANSRRGVRIALVGATLHEARAIMVEGVSGLLRVAKLRGETLSWEPSLGRLRWRNGSEAQIFSGENPDGLRGPSMISPGPTSWRSGPSPKRRGTICRWGCGVERGPVR